MWWNALQLALREIRRNVMRSFLTILGIVIGVAAVITMVTLGGGATAQVTQDVASLGSNLLMVTPGQRMGMGQRTVADAFDLDDVEALASEISSITAASGSSTAPATVIYGNENWSTSINGVDISYFEVKDRAIEKGRLFTDGEMRSGKAVCLLGATVKKELFGNGNPLGEKIRLKKISCQVIGVLESKGQSSMGSDQDDVVLTPIRTFQRRIAGNQDIKLIQVSVRDGISTDKARKDIESLMRERRNISTNEDNDFSIMDMKEIAKMLTGITQVLTTLLGAVAAVSLLVGGIGIMNIMLVSVTERTREIGIRLAIGALAHEVLMQFLVEAVVLSSFGGLFGIVLALLASVIMAEVMQIPFILNPGIILLAFLFSAMVGVVFGYFPARRAAQLNPIEALRHE